MWPKGPRGPLEVAVERHAWFKVVIDMPNAIYPPQWHKVPPPERPGLDWLVVAALAVVVIVLALAMVLGGATG